MKTQSQRHSILLALILSLLIHMGVLFLVILYKNDIITHNLLSSETLPHEDQKKNDDEWAETKTRASHCGAPVFFQDTPEDDTSIYEPTQNKPEQNLSDQHITHNEQDTQQPTDLIQEMQPIQQPLEITEKEKKTANKDIFLETIAPKTVSTEQSKNTSPQETQTPVSKSQNKTTPTSRYQQPPQATHLPTALIKRPPTLAQLTHGFLHQPKDEGTCTVKMLGNKNKTPSTEQMKYEAYLQKLGWCLQNSFNINQNRLQSRESLEGIVIIYLALNKDGMLKELRLAQSSGNIRLDQLVLFVVKDASSSFPPVPHYLPHDPFTLFYSISINIPNTSTIGSYRD